jgi:hypothetical protein
VTGKHTVSAPRVSTVQNSSLGTSGFDTLFPSPGWNPSDEDDWLKTISPRAFLLHPTQLGKVRYSADPPADPARTPHRVHHRVVGLPLMKGPRASARSPGSGPKDYACIQLVPSGPSRMTTAVRELFPCPVAQNSLRSSSRVRWPEEAAGLHCRRPAPAALALAALVAPAAPGGDQDGGCVVSRYQTGHSNHPISNNIEVCM